jgi:asparagine synthase (glutamine-hydrolysing)
MCGIAGWISYKNTIDEKVFTEMRDTLVHRGPDDAGNYFSEDSKIALGHRRLSFLDLSPSGKQPMCNENESVWIVLNGEIYNYIELRNQLSNYGHFFKSTSDTEVLIHGYEQWGIDGLLSKIKGMFAFAILDLKNKLLTLVRDRFGIKPLYYHSTNTNFIFASELKAILKSNAVNKEIDYSSFADFFAYRYVPSPKTIWKKIFKLPPSHFLQLNLKTSEHIIKEYWSLVSDNKIIDSSYLANEIGHFIEKSVYEHSKSDVEIGSFLSGGYDSSTIVYYLSKLISPVKTFSIGFDNWDKSEHQYAESVSKKLNTIHSNLIADNNSLNFLKKLGTVYDEPIADISIIPTYLVSELASRQVKAVMSGEGADELFGGYEWQKNQFARYHSETSFDKIKHFFQSKNKRQVSAYAGYMSMGRFDKNNLSDLINPDLHHYIENDVEWFYRKHFDANLSPLKSVQYLDIKCFMAELVLTKIDRASMAHSLEVRVQFLDHELFEKIFQHEETVYYKPDKTKYMIYENIKNVFSDEILNRNKQGFVGPDKYYMNIEWYKEIINNGILLKNKIINQKQIDIYFVKRDHWRLWKLAVMENWWQHWMN